MSGTLDRIKNKRYGMVVIHLAVWVFILSGGKAFPSGRCSPDSTGIAREKEQQAYDDSIVQFNRFGSFGSSFNGFRANVTTGPAGLLTSYGYRNTDGYREHSRQYAHTFDALVKTSPSANSGLDIRFGYLNGREYRPGSLTRQEFEADPFGANPRMIGRNDSRITRKGDLGLDYNARFGHDGNQKIEVSGNGQIEYFERITKEFKITTRYVFGLSARYVNSSRFLNRNSEFTAGINFYEQPDRKEEYENFSGQRSDILEQVETEKTVIRGCSLSEFFELLPKRLTLSLSGRYNHIVYNVGEQSLPARHDKRTYDALTPEASLDYTPVKHVTLFASLGLGFRNPAHKELESPLPSFLFNQELKAQTSTDLNAGVRYKVTAKGPARFWRSFRIEARVVMNAISNEIVRYEIYGDDYFRNASGSSRLALKLNTRLEIIRDLDLSVKYTWCHFVYKTYTARVLEADSSGTLVPVDRDFSGNYEPNIPASHLNISLSYRYPVCRHMAINAEAAYLNVSGLWLDDGNSAKSAAFDLANSRLGIDLRFGHFSCSIDGGVNNIFDRVYVESANTNSADRRYYDAGSPRDFSGSVRIAYSF